MIKKIVLFFCIFFQVKTCEPLPDFICIDPCEPNSCIQKDKCLYKTKSYFWSPGTHKIINSIRHFIIPDIYDREAFQTGNFTYSEYEILVFSSIVFIFVLPT